jgi:hypothetical protein
MKVKKYNHPSHFLYMLKPNRETEWFLPTKIKSKFGDYKTPKKKNIFSHFGGKKKKKTFCQLVKFSQIKNPRAHISLNLYTLVTFAGSPYISLGNHFKPKAIVYHTTLNSFWFFREGFLQFFPT